MSGVRYRLIDSLRGLSLLNMLAFHFLYDVFVIYGGDAYWPQQPGIVAWERYICCSFILIAGVSVNFSRHAVRRGLLVNACGLAITIITLLVMPEQRIIFGVLNLIGCGMLLTHALRKPLERCDPFFGAAACFLLFAFFYGLPTHTLGFFNIQLIQLPDALYSFPPLAVLGLPDNSFYSADYFPLVPWLFLFVCGFFLWRIVVRLHAERYFVRGVPGLAFIGKYSLWIYLIHQPLLMGVCFLIFGRL